MAGADQLTRLKREQRGGRKMSHLSETEALDAAVHLLLHGHDLEACLAPFPEHAAMLRPCVKIGIALHELATANDLAAVPLPTVAWEAVLANIPQEPLPVARAIGASVEERWE